MVFILVKHKVKDFEKFKKAFYENLKIKNSGSKGGYMLRNKDNKNEVWVLVEWESLESFNEFGKKAPKDSLVKGTVIGIPEGWFFDDYEKF